MQRSIRGPRSALTDYLASQNISASRIRADNEARRRDAAANAAATSATTADATAEDGQEVDSDDEEQVRKAGVAAIRQAIEEQRKRKQAEAIDKIKKSKAFKRRKRNHEDSDDDDLARALFEEGPSAPVPGQMVNCEECKKRFTVTAYTRAAPEGGLLCPKCAIKLADDEKDTKKKGRKKATAKPGSRSRRQIQSRLLDGQIGVKSLMTLCVETLANNISLADSFGDLVPIAVNRIARQLSKRRLLNPQTLQLFLQPDAESITLYDAARIGQEDYKQVFGVCSKLKHLKVRNGIQFQNAVMEYLIGRNLALQSIYLSGANLLAEDCWMKFLKAKGKALKSLRVYFTDKHFGDELVGSLKDYCPDLVTLKICHNQQVSGEGVEHIAHLENLERLGLHLVTPTSTMPYVRVIESIGKNLRAFSLRMVPEVDDRLLHALHDNCTNLTKLRITGSEVMTDAGFARLFRGWKNRPLTFIDLEKCCHVDSANPHKNTHMVGLCSNAFTAIMAHSGIALRHLNLHACRHISREAFEKAFSVDKVYPNLTDLELSFCDELTDFIVGSIFRCCPKLWRLNVFGCMKLREVRVPKGKILVGMPNAIGMVIEGTDD